MVRGTSTGVEMAGGGDPRRAALPPDALALLARLERDTRDRRGALLRRRMERQAAFAAGIRPRFLPATQRLRAGAWRVAAPPAPPPSRVVVWPAAEGARLRAWTAFEPTVVVDGRPVAAALHDFVAHLAARLAAHAPPPHRFRLPDLESHLEARLWSELMSVAQEQLSLPAGALQATVAIETLPALFEIDELLWELAPFASALELDRAELARSTIEKLAEDPAQLTPELDALLGPQRAALAAQQLLLVTARRRGVAALLAAHQPAPCIEEPRAADALDALCRELTTAAHLGFDGVAVADASLLELAQRRFVDALPQRPAVGELALAAVDGATPEVEEQLLEAPRGPRSPRALEEGLAALLAVESAGRRGAIAFDGRWENATTAALRRAQLGQWLRHRARLDDGSFVTADVARALLDAQVAAARGSPGAAARAARVAEQLGLAD